MKTEQERQQYLIMTRSSVQPLIIKMAIPTIISMIVTAVYNIGDTFFVSQLGTSASGAVGVILPLMNIIQAIGFTIGMGSGSICSRVLGERDHDRANRIASSAFALALVLGVAFTFLGIAVVEPLVVTLGATETIKPYAVDYAKYIVLGAPVMTCSYVLNNLLRSQGKAKLAMFGIASGGIINLVLDPIFIFGFGLETAGAAIATVISQVIGFIILLVPFINSGSIVRINFRHMTMPIRDILFIIVNGLPSFCRQGLSSISTVLLNRAAAEYGDAAVAAMSIVGKVFMMVFAVGLGVGQGYMPVVGQNYGAKKYLRCRTAFNFTTVIGTIIMTVLGAVLFIFAPDVIRIFIDNDPDVVTIGAAALRAQCISMPLLSLNVACNMTFQTIGKSWTATFLSALRQGVFFLPLIIVLPRVIGLYGVTYTQAISDALSFLLCIPFAVSFLRGLPREDVPDEEELDFSEEQAYNEVSQTE